MSKKIINKDIESLNSYLKDIKKIEVLNPETELELIKLAKKGDDEAKSKLVTGHLRFVITIAKDYQNNSSNLNLNDLINEGNIGLIKAIEKFDETKGFKFISYAVWWIRQSILQSIYENNSSIRLPVNRINALSKINKAREKLFHNLNREPTLEEIEKFFEDENKDDSQTLKMDDIKIALEHTTEYISLDNPIGDEYNSTIQDVIEGEGKEEVEAKMNTESLKYEINSIMDEYLTDREKQIIDMYFGLNGNHQMTLKEIGDVLNITNERVRQIKETAIRKFRSYKHSHLREYINLNLE